jgi:ketosteroid isomerase-like protein
MGGGRYSWAPGLFEDIRFAWIAQLPTDPYVSSMPSAKSETVKAFYEAWNRRDLDAALAVMAEDLEILPLPILWAGEPIRGHAEAREFWGQFFAGFDEIRVEADGDLVEIGETMVVPTRWYGRTRGGPLVEQKSVDLWTFEGEHATRLEGFATPADAIRAAESRASTRDEP